IPLPDALFLMHGRYLIEPPSTAEELAQQRGLQAADVLAVLDRIEAALGRGGVAAGEPLRQAIATKHREMSQEETVRSIVSYASLTAARETLTRAQAEGTAVEDLPAGMTLEEALANVEAHLAEFDRYLYTLEDGCLIRQHAESEGEDGASDPS